MRLAVTDVAYRGTVGCAAAVVLDAWTAQYPTASRATLRSPVAEYRPGAFFERELPCLLGVLEGLGATHVVVDGYVWLDDAGREGLGAHLHARLGLPVVGVAKTAFQGSAHARAVVRGASRSPLYVTAAGLDLDAAAAHVREMHGPHRIPTALALADHLARQGRAT